MKLTKAQQSLFDAGKAAGKRETYVFLRNNTEPAHPKHNEYAAAALFWHDRAERYMKHAEKELRNEQN